MNVPLMPILFQAPPGTTNLSCGSVNLWALREGEYLLAEAKNEVHKDRGEINKDETGQMNNATGWFKNHYPGAKVHNFIIIPTAKVGAGAVFNEEVGVMRIKDLSNLKENVRRFFGELEQLDFRTITEERVQQKIDAHSLSTTDLVEKYHKKPQMF
ncbi:MAG: hypothetical protein P4L99_23735 [Chthoniobacter sp.]|nr:hypothetical protein [Chthoniobacter sp.]